MAEKRDISEDRQKGKRLLLPKELAELWSVPVTWIYDYTRSRCEDPIPCQRLGKYVRFNLDDPRLLQWLDRQAGKKRPGRERKSKKRGESQQKEVA